MRRGVLSLALVLYLAFTIFGCSKKPADNSTDTASTDTQSSTGKDGEGSHKEAREQKEHREAKREPIVVPTGTSISVMLSSAMGSKLSKTGDAFTGSIANDVIVGSLVAIPKGANVNGTVVDAKPLGKFKGGASLEVRLDSINVHGADVPVQAAARSFTEKGKGKRTAVLAGGGAALGAIIGAVAGGGKGAAIGAAAGGGAGAGGAAFTGNKEIVLPAESDLTFELSQPLELRR